MNQQSAVGRLLLRIALTLVELQQMLALLSAINVWGKKYCFVRMQRFVDQKSGDVGGSLWCTDARLSCAQVFQGAQGGCEWRQQLPRARNFRVICCPDCVGRGECGCDECGRVGWYRVDDVVV
jgi:hypothetical protein